MRSFIFVLGRNPKISVAEIRAVLEKNNWGYEVVLLSNEILIIDSENIIPEILNNTLGGTVKIGIVLGFCDKEDLEKIIDIKFLTEKVFSQTERKIQYGISVYNGGNDILTNSLSAKIINISKLIKKELEGYNFSARFAFSKDRYLSSVTVSKNKFIEKGAEILLISSKEGVIIGKTLFVQEFEEFSKRDYGRPVRDMKSGVMPPKLARIMINLARVDKNKVVLDPFCGSGTVLQEAAILGYKNIYGRDVSEKAVKDTKENISWLLDKNPQIQTKIDIERCDVKNLFSKLTNKVSAIVTEPYLGPTLHFELYDEKFIKLKKELEDLYISAFEEFKKVLDKNGVVVFILPVFRRKNKEVSLDIIEKIEKLGFENLKISESLRGSITVGNKFDFVLREVAVFKSK